MFETSSFNYYYILNKNKHSVHRLFTTCAMPDFQQAYIYMYTYTPICLFVKFLQNKYVSFLHCLYVGNWGLSELKAYQIKSFSGCCLVRNGRRKRKDCQEVEGELALSCMYKAHWTENAAMSA